MSQERPIFSMKNSEMGLSKICLAVMILVLGHYTSPVTSQEVRCHGNDLKALIGFQSCLDSTIEGWNSSISPDCCDWAGVYCSSQPSLRGKKRVVRLELGNRRIKGKLCEPLAGLDQLKILNLSSNEFRGRLSHRFFGLYNLEILDLSDNNLVGPVVASECNVRTQLRFLDLSYNRFYGEIPNSLGNCSFYGMRQLEILDLSRNRLCGTIPLSLLELHFLSNFNVSFNRLSGEIPHGGQFDMFPWSSFKGNRGLWGHNFLCCDSTEQAGSISPINIKDSTGFDLVFGFGTLTSFFLTVAFCFASGWAYPRV